MPDQIEQGFVISFISFPPNKKTGVLLVQPSDKEIEQKPSVPSLDCTVGFFSVGSELVKSKICLLCSVARCMTLVLHYVSIICSQYRFPFCPSA